MASIGNILSQGKRATGNAEPPMQRFNRWMFRRDRTAQATLLTDLAPSFRGGVSALEEFSEMRKYGRGIEQQLAKNVLRFLELGLPWTYGLYGYFDQSVVEIMSIAEKTGNLPGAMQTAANQMQAGAGIVGIVLKAITYPSFIILMLTFVMTTLTAHGGAFDVMASLTPVDRWPANIVAMRTWALFITSYWWLVILVLAGIFFGIRRMLLAYQGPIRLIKGSKSYLVPPRSKLDDWPLFKTYRMLQSADFIASVGLLISNGIALRNALETLVGNTAIPDEVKLRDKPSMSAYLTTHVHRMLGRMATRATRYYEIFDTGLFTEELVSRIRLVEKRKDAKDAIADLSVAIRAKVLRRLTITMRVVQYALMAAAGSYVLWFIQTIFALQDLANNIGK